MIISLNHVATITTVAVECKLIRPFSGNFSPPLKYRSICDLVVFDYTPKKALCQ